MDKPMRSNPSQNNAELESPYRQKKKTTKTFLAAQPPRFDARPICPSARKLGTKQKMNCMNKIEKDSGSLNFMKAVYLVSWNLSEL